MASDCMTRTTVVGKVGANVAEPARHLGRRATEAGVPDRRLALLSLARPDRALVVEGTEGGVAGRVVGSKALEARRVLAAEDEPPPAQPFVAQAGPSARGAGSPGAGRPRLVVRRRARISLTGYLSAVAALGAQATGSLSDQAPFSLFEKRERAA